MQRDTHTVGKATEIFSGTTDEAIKNLYGAGETKGTNIWPCHLDATLSPAGQASKGVLLQSTVGIVPSQSGGCCSRARGHMQQEEGTLLRASSYEREDSGLVVYDVQPGGSMHRRDITSPQSVCLCVCMWTLEEITKTQSPS